MKEFVKDLHYNYRWSSWSKSINDIYDYEKLFDLIYKEKKTIISNDILKY